MSESEQEARLVQRAKDGHPDAFAEIYDCHQPAIYRYIAYRVGSDAVAEDLCSEVFTRMVEHIDGFTYHGRPLIAWLYTIARNLVNEHHRRGGYAAWVSLDESLTADGPDPEGLADLTLNTERLAAALQGLTDGQREVIILRFLEGLDNVTVAQILDKSYGAVKALQHRGLGALREMMGHD